MYNYCTGTTNFYLKNDSYRGRYSGAIKGIQSQIES